MKDSFCIEINDAFTRLCDANLTGNQIEIVSVGQKETTPFYFTSASDVQMEKQVEVINKLHTDLKITKKNVNVVIPDNYAFSQIIEMPSLKEKELLAAIHYQADEFIPMPIEETSLDLEILREDPKTRKSMILIVASPKSLVNYIEKTITKAGLTPFTLENELSAIGRVFSDILKPKESATLIINFGLNNTSVYVVSGDNSLLILNRSFNLGLNLFIKDISINLNWDDKKTLQALRSIGLTQNASYNLGEIVNPLLKELFNELEKIQILLRDKYNKKIETIYTMNFANSIASFNTAIQQHLNIRTIPLQLENNLVQNTNAKTIAKDITSFISAIAGNLR